MVRSHAPTELRHSRGGRADIKSRAMKLNALSTTATVVWMAFLSPMILVAATPAEEPQPTSFAGTWMEEIAGNVYPLDYFRLDLVVKDGRICGTHMATINNGNEGSARGGVSVTGVFKGSIGIIDINDGNFIYHGTLEFHGATLRWTRQSVTETPDSSLFSTAAVWPTANLAKTNYQPTLLKQAKENCGEAPAK